MSRIPPVPKNVIEPIPDGRERFTDIRFPILGIDVSQELEAQRPGTTPSGDNVRTFEKITYRGRGGVRPGLSKFLNDQVAPVTNSNPEPIQNLTVVIDPSGALFPFPFNDVPGEWFDNADPSNLDRNLIFDGYVGDAYEGGSGFLPNKNAPAVPKVVITADNLSKPEGSTYTFSGTEFSVDNGITKYRTYTAAQATAAQAEVDKRDAAQVAAQTAYDNDPTDATKAYLDACTAAAIKATAVLSKAQALKARADAAEVQTVSLRSLGAPSDAAEGTYSITASNAKGVNLDLFRLKYTQGIMTVTPVAEISFVQSKVNQGTASPLTLTMNSSVTAGNLLVVFWSGNFGSVGSVTDTLGNTYTSAGTAAVGGSSRGQCYYCISGSSGGNTVTVTSGGNMLAACVLEYTGVRASSFVVDYQRCNNNGVTGFINLKTPTVNVNPGSTSLAADITTITQTSISVASSTGFPSTPFIIKIDSEELRVANVSGTTWTVSRAWNGTTAATHSSGSTVTQFNKNLLLGMFTMFFDVDSFVPMSSPVAATTRVTQNDGENYMAMWVEEVIDTTTAIPLTGTLGGLGALNGAPNIGIAFRP